MLQYRRLASKLTSLKTPRRATASLESVRTAAWARELRADRRDAKQNRSTRAKQDSFADCGKESRDPQVKLKAAPVT